MDREGPHHYNSSYPLRYYVYVAEKAQNLEELQEKAISEPKNAQKPKKNQNSLINVLAQSDSWVQDASVQPGEEDHSVQTLQFTLHKDTTYYLYVFINEQPIKDVPLTFTLGKSPHQEEKEQEEEERRQRELEAQKAREEAQRLKALEAQKEVDEKERRAQETVDKVIEKRAQEKLKEHLQQQKEQQMRAEEERKMRKEAAVGGGFDLNKIKALQKQYTSEPKNDLKAPNGLKPIVGNTNIRGPTPRAPVNAGNVRGNTPKDPLSTTASSMSKSGGIPPTMSKSGGIPKPNNSVHLPPLQKVSLNKPVTGDKYKKSTSLSSEGDGSNTSNPSNPKTPASATLQDKKPQMISSIYGKKPSATVSFPNKFNKK